MNDIQVNITIISDLHCKHSSKDQVTSDFRKKSTNLYTDLLRSEEIPVHPVKAFIDLVEKSADSFKSDLLLCPGDITDEIDHQGYITGWSFLEEMQAAVQAPHLLATLGNHDVDSRRIVNGELPFSLPRSIKPNYPIGVASLRQDFWNDHYCIFETECCQVLLFNSCYTHLSSNDAKKSVIKEDVLKSMERKLSILPKGKIRIALCHHHPISHSNVSYPDTDIIDKGEHFLELLIKYDFSLIVHGHKHEPRIRYYNSLVVFCAGSFSSTANVTDSQSDNVFHRIEFKDIDRAIIKTWAYGSRNGWTQKMGQKFPSITGFGCKDNIQSLAADISKWFEVQGNGMLERYDRLISAIPAIQFVIQSDFEKLINILKSQYSVDIGYDLSGYPEKVSKAIK